MAGQDGGLRQAEKGVQAGAEGGACYSVWLAQAVLMCIHTQAEDLLRGRAREGGGGAVWTRLPDQKNCNF